MSIQNSNRIRALKILCLVLSFTLMLLWLGFIFSNSLKSGGESTEQSSKVHQTVNQVAGSLGVKQEISEETVRSGAHFTEFGILGFLVCLCVGSLWNWKPNGRLPGLMLWALLSVPVCALLALADELLQTFSEGRSAQLVDVLLDTAGASVGTVLFIGILWLAWLIQNRKKEKRHESE